MTRHQVVIEGDVPSRRQGRYFILAELADMYRAITGQDILHSELQNGHREISKAELNETWAVIRADLRADRELPSIRYGQMDVDTSSDDEFAFGCQSVMSKINKIAATGGA